MWKPCFGFNKYEINSETSEIRNIKTRKIRSPTNIGGYTRLSLTIDNSGVIQKGASVHRLMMLTFNYIDNHAELEVNHKNGIRTDNSLDNLEWCTREENAKHSSEKDFLKISMKKLSNNDVLEIRDLLNKSNFRQWEIAEMYNVSRTNISAIATRRSRKYI